MADILPPAPIDAPFASYNWTDWYKKVRDAINSGGTVTWNNIDFTGSNITSIATRPHNSLQSLQGGTAGEYYHLTAAEYAALAGDSWTYVKLATDFSTSSSTAVDVTGLTFTPDPSETYVVEAFLLTESSSTTVGVKPGVAWPTGLTNGAARIDATNTSTTTVIANVNYSGAGEASGTDWPAADTSYPVTITATFITGASPSGSFKVTLARE
jgi:hypothetical protein